MIYPFLTRKIATYVAVFLFLLVLPQVTQAQVLNFFPTNTPYPHGTPSSTPAPSVTFVPLTVTPTEPVRAIITGTKTGVFVQNATDTVVVRDGDILYLGGNFSEVQLATDGAALRPHLASVDVTKNQITSWNPAPNGRVETIATDDKLVYVGGRFTQVANVKRNYVAIFDKPSGALTNWDPNANDWVYSIHVDSRFMWIAGRFTAIGGQNRLRLAAFKKDTGDIDAFNVGANDEIYALAGDDRILYVGGAFTEIGGQPRRYLAAIDKQTGKVTDWAPQINNKVRKIVLQNGMVVVFGPFTQVNGVDQRFNAVIDPSTGKVSKLQILDASGNPLPPTISGIQIAESDLGFKIPGLADILTFVVRIFFVIAGLIALLYLLLGAFAWITSGGEEENVTKARQKIIAAIIGVILIVAVLAVIVTLEQVVFRAKICFGISCPATIPSLIKPCKTSPTDTTPDAVDCTHGNGPASR